ncbi:MAG: DUF2141 domain-containing protein [Brevundimonas sp.]
MKRASPLAVALLLAASPAAASDLTLSLSTQAPGGRIAIAVYRDAGSMRRGEGAVRTALIPRTGRITTTTLSGLAPGRYAVAVFHDTDGNGRLSTWPIGLPKEAYGFSRNARGRFGPPAFEAAAFDLPAAGARQEISLR